MIVAIVTFTLPRPWSVEWKAMVAQKYGAPPDILYAEVPVSVDNVARTIEIA